MNVEFCEFRHFKENAPWILHDICLGKQPLFYSKSKSNWTEWSTVQRAILFLVLYKDLYGDSRSIVSCNR